jgi:hypothetical protein
MRIANDYLDSWLLEFHPFGGQAQRIVLSSELAELVSSPTIDISTAGERTAMTLSSLNLHRVGHAGNTLWCLHAICVAISLLTALIARYWATLASHVVAPACHLA